MTGGNNIWNDTFLSLASLYRDEFYRSDTDGYLRLLVNSEIRVMVLCESYGVMVKLKMIEPIESISTDEKWELYNEAKRLSNKQDKEHLVRASKVLYCLGQYLQV